MLRRISNTLIIIIGVAMMCSCHHSDTPDPTPSPTVCKKTLLMYWPYTGTSNNLYDFFLDNIGDIEKYVTEQGGLGDNHLVYFISPSASTSYLINVEFKKNAVVRDTLKTYLNPELTTSTFISSVLNDVKTEAPANNYDMVIGCHGEGWMPGTNYTTTQKKSRFFGSGSYGYQTDINTLADAITASNMHMQYILFDDCYMSCIENAYALKDVTDYVIASTSEIMNYGMPYKYMLSAMLQEQPDYEAICNNFLSFYSTYYLPYGTLGVTRTEYVEQMAELMKQINTTYSITSTQLALVQDLDASHHIPTIYFDFGDYVTKMLTDDSDDATKAQMLAQFNDLLAKLVPYKVSTEYILSDSPYKVIPVNSFSGISISDPSLHPDAVDTKTETLWWNATH